ncbi:MAG: DUF429 domain-containing protein [Gemmatimonadetes bacterium]|nr:DUF429 domain-containing protein [Gemmatimonadota bacterium]
MRIYGVDFTSRPTKQKPITCLACSLNRSTLVARSLHEWADFESFEHLLREPGPWIAGLDFPFGQSRTFIENIEWPDTWSGYVRHVAGLERASFRRELDGYRAGRAAGDKEHRRATDRATGAVSSQKLYGTPVGLMFFEGAPRLLSAGVTIPHVRQGDPDRVVVEAYPGVLARALIGRRSYKQDTRAKQSQAHAEARRDLFEAVTGEAGRKRYGVRVQARDLDLAHDPGGDRLDALLCAVQAAWAWLSRANGFGAPADVDSLEGWIADPGAHGADA